MFGALQPMVTVWFNKKKSAAKDILLCSKEVSLEWHEGQHEKKLWHNFYFWLNYPYVMMQKYIATLRFFLNHSLHFHFVLVHSLSVPLTIYSDCEIWRPSVYASDCQWKYPFTGIYFISFWYCIAASSQFRKGASGCWCWTLQHPSQRWQWLDHAPCKYLLDLVQMLINANKCVIILGF